MEHHQLRTKLFPLILTAVLIMSAGCGGISSVPEPSTTTTGTPTSPDHSSSRSTAEPIPELAPGLTESGVTDAWALAQAHRDNISNTTYTERGSRSVYVNGTLLRNVSTILERGQDERYIYNFHTYGTENGFSRNLTVFHNESTLIQRTTYDNGTVAYTGPENAATPQTDQYGGVYSILTTSNTTVVNTIEEDGSTLYRVNSVSSPSQSSEFADVDNYEMSALIDTRGVVHEYIISYQKTRDGRVMNITVNRRFTNLGETIVDPPEWVVDTE